MRILLWESERQGDEHILQVQELLEMTSSIAQKTKPYQSENATQARKVYDAILKEKERKIEEELKKQKEELKKTANDRDS